MDLRFQITRYKGRGQLQDSPCIVILFSIYQPSCPSVRWLVGRLVCHGFLKRQVSCVQIKALKGQTDEK